MSEILFGLIFAHFVADYLLQTNKINKQKMSQNKTEQRQGFELHILHHLICYVAVYIIIFLFHHNLSIFSFFSAIGTILFIIFVHYLIDLLKVKLTHEKDTLFKASAYVVDQILHITVVWIALCITQEIEYGPIDIVEFFRSLFSNEHNYVLLSLKDKAFLLGTMVIITTHFYGYLIGIMLKPFEPKAFFTDTKIETKTSMITDTSDTNEENMKKEKIETTTYYSENPNSAGIYIGMIERLIIIILMTSTAISAIGFLIALKALTRFKQFDDKHFAEYYLIGNLLSILFGFVTSYFVLRIISL